MRAETPRELVGAVPIFQAAEAASAEKTCAGKGEVIAVWRHRPRALLHHYLCFYPIFNFFSFFDITRLSIRNNQCLISIILNNVSRL